MALPSLASVSDLADWLGETIAEGDKRAAAVLQAASTLVRAYTGKDWLSSTDSSQLVDPIPDAVHTVTLAVAGRAWLRPGDFESTTETAGPFGETKRYVGDGSSLYLTKTEKLMLRVDSVTTTRGIGVLSTTRGEDIQTVYVPVEGTETPFPMYASDDPSL